jgi:hypothetical protein
LRPTTATAKELSLFLPAREVVKGVADRKRTNKKLRNINLMSALLIRWNKL